MRPQRFRGAGVGTVCLVGISLSGCSNPPRPPELLGGQATVFDRTPNAFSNPVPGLDREQELLFFVGNSFFNQNWVTAPASTTARDGVGPLFNTRSCAGCHFRDGRGRPPDSEDELGTGLLLRLSLPARNEHGDHVPDPRYGGQLQDQAVRGVPPEGRVRIEHEEVPGRYPDGAAFSLRKPRYEIGDTPYGDLHPEVGLSPRIAPQMIGLGLLEAVSESDIRAMADPEDTDGDGISGRPNEVWDVAAAAVALGRFGWKANEPSVRQQSAGAFLGDMGITTNLFPAQECTSVQEGCLNQVGGGDPEIEDEDLDKVVLYASSLAVPALRDPDSPSVVEGFSAFLESGCAVCHTPTLRTATHPTIPALSDQVIHPFTDLLLHDMGDGLADGRGDFEATGSEWRTAPLWGVGLVPVVNGHHNYLHDGRARSLEEAILWHGGEAEASRNRFMELPADTRSALLRFLEAL